MKILVLLLLALSLPLLGQELTVGAAADLRPAMDEIVSRFQAANPGTTVKVSYGSSGNFFQQIQSGAPFDLFFSANTEYPKKLESAGLAVADSYYEYARGKIVLLVPSKSELDLKQGLRLLLDSKVRKIAIADPGHAPYGQAAVAALKHESIYEQVSGKLVTGENISQAASYVLSGAADVAIASLSLALSPASKDKVRYAEISANDYPAIQQACVIVRASKGQGLAQKFVEYFKSREAVAVLERYGFEVPKPQ